ncbi:MAG: hypothetical protein ACRDH9_12895 [Actinomycetota bacterium]
MKRPAQIASAVLLVLTTAAPGMADHIDRLPFGKTEVVGAGWASFMIHTDGSVVGVPLWLKAPGSVNELGAFFYDEQEAFLGGFQFAVHRAKTRVYADIRLVPGQEIHQDQTIQAEPEGGFGMTPTYDPHGEPATFKLLVWGAGEMPTWTFDGSANPADVRLLGIERGTHAFMYQSTDFQGAANTGAHVLGAGGRGTVLADLAMDVTDTLVANFLTQSNGTVAPFFGISQNRTTVTTPTGEDECLYVGFLGCSYRDFIGPGHRGPGRYVFHLSGAGAAAVTDTDEVVLSGADARLPVDQTQGSHPAT